MKTTTFMLIALFFFFLASSVFADSVILVEKKYGIETSGQQKYAYVSYCIGDNGSKSNVSCAQPGNTTCPTIFVCLGANQEQQSIQDLVEQKLENGSRNGQIQSTNYSAVYTGTDVNNYTLTITPLN